MEHVRSNASWEEMSPFSAIEVHILANLRCRGLVT
jgi:hypothetical protein